MFAGEERFAEMMEARPGTFFLTDWLVRNFDRAVVRGLGLDRHPDIKPILFGNYEAIVYLRQMPNPRLAETAKDIAKYLGLRLEIEDVGLGELEERLAALVETDSPSVATPPALPPPRPRPNPPPKCGGETTPPQNGGSKCPDHDWQPHTSPVNTARGGV